MSEPNDAGYRDALGAAHARVEELEHRVAELEAHLALSPERRAAIDARIEEIRGVQAQIAKAGATARYATLLTGTVCAFGTLAFTGAIASMGERGHPFNAFALGATVSFAVTALAHWLSGTPERRARDRFATLQQQASIAPGGARVRVVDEEQRPSEAEAETSRETPTTSVRR